MEDNNLAWKDILVTFKQALRKAHPLKATGSMSSFHDE